MSAAHTVLAAAAAAAACWLAWGPSPARHLLEGRPSEGTSRDGHLPTIPVSRRLLYAGGSAVAGLMLIPGWRGVVVATLVSVAIFLLSRRLVPLDVRRTRRQLVEERPECLSLLASALAAGSPLRVAVVEVAGVSPPATRRLLESVAGHVEVGRGEDEAWRTVVDDPVTNPVWGMAARDLARHAHSGTAVVEQLRRHALDSRAELSGAVEKQARTVGVQSVLPLMVCFLPGFVLVGVVPIIAGLVGQFSL